jgi:DNA-binding HxlR family transcriptional regulator
MQRTSYRDMECPVARSLEEVGEWWSILIMRDALLGLRRFDEFQQSLGVAPTTLTRRLNALVDNGLLTKRRYSERPPRDEYLLTDKGRDFQSVVLALLTWGSKHLSGPEGPSLQVVDRHSGTPVTPTLMDAGTLQPLTTRNTSLIAGPGAGPEIHNRIDQVTRRREAKERTR